MNREEAIERITDKITELLEDIRIIPEDVKRAMEFKNFISDISNRLQDVGESVKKLTEEGFTVSATEMGGYRRGLTMCYRLAESYYGKSEGGKKKERAFVLTEEEVDVLYGYLDSDRDGLIDFVSNTGSFTKATATEFVDGLTKKFEPRGPSND